MPYGLALYDIIALLKNSKERQPAHKLVPLVARAEEDMPDLFDDIYVIEAADYNIFDLDGKNAVAEMTEIIGLTPVYRMSLELMIDEALRIRVETDEDDPVARAIVESFSGVPLPEATASPAGDEVQTELTHSALEHLTDTELAKVYVRFLRALPAPDLYPNLFFNEMIKLDRAEFLERYDGIKLGQRFWLRFDTILRQARPAADRVLSAQSPESLKKYAARHQSGGFDNLTELVVNFLQLERRQLLRGEGLLWLHDNLGHISLDWLDHELAKLMILEYQKEDCAAALKALRGEEEPTGIDSALMVTVDAYRKGAKSAFANAVFDQKPQRLWPVLKDFMNQVKHRQHYAERLHG